MSRFRAVGWLCLVLVAAGCRGSGGGSDRGRIAGTVSSSIGGAAANVTVQTRPLAEGGTQVTGPNGEFNLRVPVGVYSVVFTNPDYEELEIENVSVVGDGLITLTTTLTRINPLVASPGIQYQAGFGKPVTLGVDVKGATGPLTYEWAQISGPTAVTLVGGGTDSPTFTSSTLDEIIAAGVFVEREPRASLIGLDHDQIHEMTWRFRATVGDGTFKTTTMVDVQPASVHGAGFAVARGILTIGNDTAAASYDWTLEKPAGSAAALEAPATRNPWLIPDVDGFYTLTNRAPEPDTVIQLRAGSWAGNVCGGCHATQSGMWASSDHATMLERGLEGELGDYYSEECISCHTVGYQPAADNGGFDDVAAAMEWSFPLLGPNAYDELPSELKLLSNVQCESCHGPAVGHVGVPNTMKASLDAAACGACHQEEPYHDLFAQWESTGHSNLELAIDEASTESRGATAAHCGRCHSGNGFVRWSTQLLGGNSGNITKPDGTPADLAYLQSLGLTKSEVQAITCATCHEPHTAGLRIPENAEFTTPAGWPVFAMGKGTLCISCHNTRNGLRDDAHPPTSFSAPHVASQSDVFMGRNAYFAGAELSDHASIGDTCVTCHVTLVPDSVDTMGVNHTFRPDRSICANCHGAGVTGEALTANVEVLLEAVAEEAALGVKKVLENRIAAGLSYRVRAWDPVTDLYSSAASSSSNILLAEAPTAISMVEIHGQSGFTMVLTTPVTITWTDGTQATTNVVSFQIGALKDTAATPQTLFVPDSVLVKGLWNYFLIHGDASGGVHNPEWIVEVLEQTEAELSTWKSSL